ncbi:lysosomal alpha-mannosidase-like isoform X1 [Pollicipes pollicipes]|uniref:lysosomal alpha-mannosidase-like isoform X1 n=1 Tax=Pollicipes pollicipes TaxID=41117 RepID=UPI00188507EA|nr:lysosomal alpha-mannosidase-like isoform X1 [Pollicipes pollicipes]
MWLRVLAMAAAALAAPREQICGYDKCPAGKQDMLNVHLVPHTHDDVGWLKTVDQYFYGAKSEIQRAGVQYILDSVIQELVKDPEKRFIYVETAFFWRWYLQQDEQTIATVENLVNEGRLEFIGGGWSMNDEACVHYNAVIDQMSLGMRTLFDHFGPCGIPRVAWQIDPFGHTKEQANMFAQMGFDGYFFGRLDYDDKKRRMNASEMEMVWLASQDLGETGEIFTGALYNIYAPPPGHCYDVNCNDQPIMDDKRLKDYNVDEKVDDFIAYSKKQAKSFKTNHIVMTMGEDFHYQDAGMWFKNMDKLIKYVNARQSGGEKVNVFYSTPSCYLKSLHDAKLVWPTVEDDFMPYASDPWAYWSGYFTSRPAQKGYIRKSNNFLQVCKQLTAMMQTERTYETPNRVDYLRYAMGVNQHHDAVTGTEKQHVANDYIQRLSEATDSCQGAVNDALTRAGLPVQTFCNHLNTSVCHVTEQSGKFVAYVYNPLSRSVSPWVRIPVAGDAYTILDPEGQAVASQLSPIPAEVLSLPGRNSSAVAELVFQASDLPPLGFKGYFIQPAPGAATSQVSTERPGLQSLSNGHVTLDLDPETLRLGRVRAGKADIQINQTFMWYEGYGNASGSKWERPQRPTGAYIFNPKGEAQVIEAKSVVTLDGALVKEYRHTFDMDWVSQVTRLYKDEPFAEVEWMVGPIPTEDGVAKEVISRFSSAINSTDTFYTDSNGRQMMKRRRNHRDTWTLNVTEPVAGNYFPVNSRIFIKDADSQLTVLTDRSQGGSSLASGQLELMLHRRTVQDDAFGVGEPLNETEFGVGLVVRGRHWVVVSDPADAPKLHRDLAEQMFMAPQLSFAAADFMTPEMWSSAKVIKQFTGMQPLPANVHLLTLEMYKPNQLLIRLEHQFQADEDPTLSKPVDVNLKDLFTTLNVTSVEEFGLSADRPLKDINRLHWDHVQSNRLPKNFRGAAHEVYRSTGAEHDPLTVTLNPMEIRTFVASYQSPYPLPTPPAQPTE